MAKFAIAKAQLENSGEFNEMSLKESGLMNKTVKLSSKKNGLNFFDEDGTLFCFGRFSKAVKQHLVAGTLSIEQILAYGKISESEYDGQTYYSLTIPEELRGGVLIGKAADVAKTAKKLVGPAKLSLADISKMIEI